MNIWVMDRSDGQELQARLPQGSRLDQSEADLRERVIRALHKKVDSQVCAPNSSNTVKNIKWCRCVVLLALQRIPHIALLQCLTAQSRRKINAAWNKGCWLCTADLFMPDMPA